MTAAADPAERLCDGYLRMLTLREGNLRLMVGIEFVACRMLGDGESLDKSGG